MHRSRSYRTALARILVVVGVLLTLGACAPFVVEMEGPSTARLNAQASGGIFVVHVPEERPEGGIVVRRTGNRSFHIPPGHYPPPGECRIWRPDVPPGQQDPPGSCADLRERVPAGAYLVEG